MVRRKGEGGRKGKGEGGERKREGRILNSWVATTKKLFLAIR